MTMTWSSEVTPNEIAAKLKLSPKSVRHNLRLYFDRRPGTWERWTLTPKQADEFVRWWRGR